MNDDEARSLRQKLALANERLESLVSTSIEMMICLEYEPPVSTSLPAEEQAERLFQSAVVASINDAAAIPYAGRKASEIIGSRFADAAPQGSHEVLRAQMREFVAQGYHHHHNEYAMPKSDGSVSYVEVNRTATIIDGCVVRSWHMSRDLTEQKRAALALHGSERALEQARKLESLGLLAGSITHDFNNLIAAFSANLEVARLDLKRGRAPDAAFASMDDAMHRARALTRRVLVFSRPELEQRREPLRLTTIVEECVRLVAPTLPDNVTLDIQAAPDTPRIAADATQMHQVVMNLLQNAIQASEERGGVVTMALDGPSGHARLVVKDTGTGMDPRTRDRMFDPFFTTKPRGTGLGLSIVHRIVTAHDGSITVKSAPGAGTEIDVRLRALDYPAPASPRPPAVVPSVSPPERSPRARANGDAHVLFVDDEPRIAELTTHVLVHYGFRVTAQTSPVLALEAFRAAPDDFDVVVTDQTMPGMSGIELAAHILALRPGLPILLASGQADPPPADALERAGIVGVLPKPFPVSTLAERIRAALNHGS